MTAMPQQIAISHGFGALAATAVGWRNEWGGSTGSGPGSDRGTMGSASGSSAVRALTVTGPLMAFGKAAGTPARQADHLALQNATASGSSLPPSPVVWLVINRATAGVLGDDRARTADGRAAGLPIGGADMRRCGGRCLKLVRRPPPPPRIRHRNTCSSSPCAQWRSGFLLSVLMSKAMNRSFGNVISARSRRNGRGERGFGHWIERAQRVAGGCGVQLAFASRVIVVPGTPGVAQAQHVVQELCRADRERGGEVKYAIHPVRADAGSHERAVGRGDVPYEKLLDNEEINPQFDQCDVALVVGAIDVVEPGGSATIQRRRSTACRS